MVKQNIKLISDISEINRLVSFELWHLANVQCSPRGLSPRLIVPQKRSGKLRISEQEARFLYCGVLNTLSYYYSVETPTERRFRLSGSTSLSARSDVSLYLLKRAGLEKVANVEFKARNSSQRGIQKDIQKLVREGLPGNWFHLLGDINSKTLHSLFNKFCVSFQNLKRIINRPKSTSVLFCFCVLQKRWACLKHFEYLSSERNLNEYINRFFQLDYRVSRRRVEIDNPHGWTLIFAED